jgi:hypothetical protein
MYSYVESLLHNGVTLGYGDGTFHPIDASLRGSTLMFVARAAVAPNGDGAILSPAVFWEAPTTALREVCRCSRMCRRRIFGASKCAQPRAASTFPISVQAVHWHAHRSTRRAQEWPWSSREARRVRMRLCQHQELTTTLALCAAITARGRHQHFPDVATIDAHCRHVNYLWARGMIDGFGDGTSSRH